MRSRLPGDFISQQRFVDTDSLMPISGSGRFTVLSALQCGTGLGLKRKQAEIPKEILARNGNEFSNTIFSKKKAELAQ